MGALWTGVSGLLSYSSAIAVTSNNLANVNTTGFKASRTLFSDLVSSMAGGTTDGSQIGTGVAVDSITLDASSGGLESSSSTLDMAIDGDHGYFTVVDPDTKKTYYTRAGSFNFDTSGNLVTPTGLNVQGWAVDQNAVSEADRTNTVLSEVPTTGEATNIQLTNYTIPAEATGAITVVTNLDSTTEPGTNDATDPYFTMFKNYDATSGTLASDADYSTSLTVYDSEGGEHDLTVYYNKITTESGKEYWEYMVAADPSEDGNSLTSGTTKAGVLMIGTLEFSAQGELENMSAYTLSSTASNASSLSSWTQASLDAGVPQFSASFRSASNSSNILSPQLISLKTGLSTAGNSWSANSAATAAGVGTSASKTLGFNSSESVNAVNCTTNYATTSYTLTTTQDGYTSGTFKSAYVDEDGVLYGRFSNGKTRPLWVIELTDFTNPSGLTRAGDTLFTAGEDAGVATTGRANSGKFDGIAGSALESSNVEMATEMVNLIMYQRSFQSNSKVVTTANEMMQTALGIKK